MTRMRSFYDADRTEKNGPTLHQTELNNNELYCSLCGETVFVDDVAFDDVQRIIEETLENPYLCPDCLEQVEEAAHPR
ncbi:MAG: hypothetical protein R2747_23465 [Pyrinomonadaceae bacterium]